MTEYATPAPELQFSSLDHGWYTKARKNQNSLLQTAINDQDHAMPDIEKLLKVGDLRSSGNSEKVVKMVLLQPQLFADVLDAIFSDNAATKMRASDVVEKVTRTRPELLKSHKKLFLDKIARIDQKEVRWHTAQILPRLELTETEREKVYHLMVQYLEDNSSIVRTFAMQALTDIALQDKSYVKKVHKLILRLMEHGSPAMTSRGKKLLVLLDSA